MVTKVEALRESVEDLRALAARLDDPELVSASYCSEWVIADVFSHIGSGAVITERTLRDAVAGTKTPDDFAPSVWDEWNAKSPRAQVDDALAADRAVLEAFEAVSEEQRAVLTFSMGPMSLDFATFAGMRLNEHVFHTWDVAVALDGTAQLLAAAVPLVVDNLEMIAGFVAKPTGETRTIVVRTTDPSRDLTITATPDSVTYATTASSSPDLVLPAEAFCRLVYGRLDPDHTPAVTGDQGALTMLRQVFSGL
jgi:uncharacterized protein (TIGR03083 family)